MPLGLLHAVGHVVDEEVDTEVVLKVDVEGLEGTCKGGLQRAQAVSTCTLASSTAPAQPFLQLLRRARLRMKMALRPPAFFGKQRALSIKDGACMRLVASRP